MEGEQLSDGEQGGGVKVFSRFRPEKEFERVNRIREPNTYNTPSKNTIQRSYSQRKNRDPYTQKTPIRASSSIAAFDVDTEAIFEFEQDDKSVTLDRNSYSSQKYVLRSDSDRFTFDRVFKPDATQEEVYNITTKPLIQEVLKGYNCTVFAYGQTGSGKTHTMMGPGSVHIDPNDDKDYGIIPRVSKDLFQAMFNSTVDTEFTIKVSYVEIYMERIRDLLNPRKDGQGSLKVRECKDGDIRIEGAKEHYVASSEELMELIRHGNENRAIASTLMNSESSRSHSVFMITVSQININSNINKASKLFLVDLAGSEMVKRTGAKHNVLEEAKMINRSLSALGNVIKSLVEGNRHIPYRDSKLTRLLQNSIGGNSKTALIVTCSSTHDDVTESLSTLRFGTRAKRIKNKPVINNVSCQNPVCMVQIKALREQLLHLLQNEVEDSESSSNHNEDGEWKVIEDLSTDTDMVEESKETASLASPTVNIGCNENDSFFISPKISKNKNWDVEMNLKQQRILELEKENMEQAAKISELSIQKRNDEFRIQQLELSIKELEAEKQASECGNTSGKSIKDLNILEENENCENEEISKVPLTKEKLLEKDLVFLTDRYVKIRLQLHQYQSMENLGGDIGEKVRIMATQLAELQNENQELDVKLNCMRTKLRICDERQSTQELKVKNREGHIKFLEAALRDYQNTFRARMEESSNQIQGLREQINAVRSKKRAAMKAKRKASISTIPKPIRGCRRTSL